MSPAWQREFCSCYVAPLNFLFFPALRPQAGNKSADEFGRSGDGLIVICGSVASWFRIVAVSPYDYVTETKGVFVGKYLFGGGI